MLVQVLIGQECRRNHASCIFSFVWQPVAFILYIYLKWIEDGGATTIHNCHHKETGCYRKKNIFFFKIYCTPTTFFGLLNAYNITLWGYQVCQTPANKGRSQNIEDYLGKNTDFFETPAYLCRLPGLQVSPEEAGDLHNN